MTTNLLNRLSKEILLFDGAMGTQLQMRGLLDGGHSPELLNIEQFDAIVDIHQSYIEAGAMVVTTNTFGGNPFKLKEASIEGSIVEVNSCAVKAARKAAELAQAPDTLVAASVGPLGELMAPLGSLTWDTAVEAFKAQIHALSDADIILLETFTDLHELRAAAFAASEVSDCDVIACIALDDGGKLLTGGDTTSLAVAMEDLSVCALGLNCGLTAPQLLPFYKDLVNATDLPLLFQGNCGLPDLHDGQMIHNCTGKEFADSYLDIIETGVNMIGGCCGSGPEHIQALKELLQSEGNSKRIRPTGTGTFDNCLRIGGRGKTATIPMNGPVTIIGEKINPTGRKAFARELRDGNLSRVRKDAMEQSRSGADILDINVGTSGVVESALLPEAVMEAASVNLPLCIDSSDVAALEEGLKACPGKALINSASAESTRMEPVFELARKYGAAVICLPVDDNGLPETIDDRISILKNMIHRALEKGIKRKNLLCDGLVTTLGASPTAAQETLETIERIKSELNLPSVLGTGNISHGLPGRDLLTGTFLSMAICKGLSSAIVNPCKEEIYSSFTASRALMGSPESINTFINYAKDQKVSKRNDRLNTRTDHTRTDHTHTDHPRTDHTPASQQRQPGAYGSSDSLSDTIALALIDGLKGETQKLVALSLKDGTPPSTLLNEVLIPAMNEVGRRFSRKDIFLPGLLASAEAMEASAALVKDEISRRAQIQSRNTDLNTADDDTSEKSGKEIKVIIASVKGDIHDIGKNIVTLMLKNSGCNVLDLGKDTKASVIIEESKRFQPDVIALSALMTTTMVNMKDVAVELKNNGLNIPLLVGGAVVNEHFAESIGATYSADAAGAVEKVHMLAKGVM